MALAVDISPPAGFELGKVQGDRRRRGVELMGIAKDASGSLRVPFSGFEKSHLIERERGGALFGNQGLCEREGAVDLSGMEGRPTLDLEGDGVA